MIEPEFAARKSIRSLDAADPSHDPDQSRQYVMAAILNTDMWAYEGELNSEVERLTDIFINDYAFIEILGECVITNNPMAILKADQPFPFKCAVWYNGLAFLCPTEGEPKVRLFVNKATANRAGFPPPWEI